MCGLNNTQKSCVMVFHAIAKQKREQVSMQEGQTNVQWYDAVRFCMHHLALNAELGDMILT